MVMTQSKPANGFALPKASKILSFYSVKKAIRKQVAVAMDTLRKKDEREWIGAYNTPGYMESLLETAAKQIQHENNCNPDTIEEARRAIENDYYVTALGL